MSQHHWAVKQSVFFLHLSLIDLFWTFSAFKCGILSRECFGVSWFCLIPLWVSHFCLLLSWCFHSNQCWCFPTHHGGLIPPLRYLQFRNGSSHTNLYYEVLQNQIWRLWHHIFTKAYFILKTKTKKGSSKLDDLTMTPTCSYHISKSHDSWGFLITQQLDIQEHDSYYQHVATSLWYL